MSLVPQKIAGYVPRNRDLSVEEEFLTVDLKHELNSSRSMRDLSNKLLRIATFVTDMRRKGWLFDSLKGTELTMKRKNK